MKYLLISFLFFKLSFKIPIQNNKKSSFPNHLLKDKRSSDNSKFIVYKKVMKMHFKQLVQIKCIWRLCIHNNYTNFFLQKTKYYFNILIDLFKKNLWFNLSFNFFCFLEYSVLFVPIPTTIFRKFLNLYRCCLTWGSTHALFTPIIKR